MTSLPIVCGLVACIVVLTSPVQASWPRWRGPDGSGVAAESGLPQQWDGDSANIKWKARIPGDGISSPIVHDGRVFVTTAYEGSESVFLADVIAYVTMGLAAVCLVLAAWRLRTNRLTPMADGAWLDAPRVWLGWLAFLAATLLTLAKNESPLFRWALDEETGSWPAMVLLGLLGLSAVSGWLRAQSVWRLLGSMALCATAAAVVYALYTRWPANRYVFFAAAVCLFTAVLIVRYRELPDVAGTLAPGPVVRLDSFLLVFTTFAFLIVASFSAWRPATFWTLGEPGPVQLASGLIAVFGLTAAVAWFRPDSLGRLAGAVVLVVAGGFLFVSTPMDLMGNPVPGARRAIAAAPAIGAACWFVLLFAMYRWRGWTPAEPSGVGNVVCAAVLLVMAGLVFTPPNYLRPKMGMQRVVVCLDLKSGKILWQTPVFLADLEPKYSVNSFATPTPCTDGRYVIAHFGSGTACLDYSGRVLWKVVDEQYSLTTVYGAATSPVLSGDVVLIVQESEKYKEGGTARPLRRPTYIVAYDKRTGKPKWRIEPDDAHDSYSTPLLVKRGGSTQLVTVTQGGMVAYDVATGARLWSHPIPIEQVVPSMVWSKDVCWVGGGTHGPKAAMALRLTGDTPRPAIETVWETTQAVPECSSPVLYDGKVFSVGLSGMMNCQDAASGKILWRKRLKGRFFASLVAGDGKVYACNEAGVTTVVAASSKFELLGTNDLGEAIYASPAIAEGCLLIRAGNHLVCIGNDR